MARKLAPWLGVTLFLAGGAYGQSLAEVAAKEKARRAKRDPAEPVRMIGSDELAQARGEGTSTSGITPSGELGAAEATEPTDRAASDASASLSEKEIRYYREAWNRVWAKQMAAAKQELEVAEYELGQCRAAAHYVFVPIGIDCNGVRERHAIAEFRVKDLEQNRFNWERLLPERSRGPPQ